MVDVSSGKRTRFDLRTFMDAHPITSLSTLVVSVATVAAGSISYISEQRLDSQSNLHKTEISNLGAKHQAELSQVTQTLGSTIEDLTSRMSSIERRVPGGGPKYLDVSTVTVSEESILRLTSNYTEYDDGNFYVALPAPAGWTYRHATELDFAMQTVPTAIRLISEAGGPALIENLRNAPIHLWQTDHQVTFFTASDQAPTEIFEFSFRPTIYVQHVDKDFLELRTKSLVNMLLGEDEPTPEVTATPSLLPVGNDVPGPEEAEPSEIASALVEHVSETEEAVDALSRMYSSDLGSFILFDFAGAAIARQSTFPIREKVISAEKRGNVLYIQVQWVFLERDSAKVTIDGVEVSGSDSRKITVAEEIFFFSRGSDGYLVHVFVPLDGQQASAYAWITNWLSGLQIPAQI